MRLLRVFKVSPSMAYVIPPLVGEPSKLITYGIMSLGYVDNPPRGYPRLTVHKTSIKFMTHLCELYNQDDPWFRGTYETT